MKKLALLSLMICFCAMASAADAAWPWQKKPVSAPQAQAPAAAAAEATSVAAPAAPETAVKEAPAKVTDATPVQPSGPALEKQRAQRAKKRAEVNNNQWEVDVMALNGKGEKQKDFLVFKDNKFSSENYSKIGFGPSNYTLSILDDGSVVVETMQSADKEGIIFWRIEWDSQLIVCKGILSRQLSENKTEDYSFLSVGKKPVMNTPPPAQAPQA